MTTAPTQQDVAARRGIRQAGDKTSGAPVTIFTETTGPTGAPKRHNGDLDRHNDRSACEGMNRRLKVALVTANDGCPTGLRSEFVSEGPVKWRISRRR